jgi:hypothetical protein
MKRVIIKYFLLFLVLCVSASLFAQQPGINFEAIARDRDNNPAKDRRVYVHVEIISAGITSTVAFAEEHLSRTNEAGIFNIGIGKGTRVGGNYNSILDIPWGTLNYNLKVKLAIEPVATVINWNYQNEWIDLGSTPFGIVPYAGAALTAQSIAPGAAVLSFSGGNTGLTPSVATTGNIELGGVLSIEHGGTGSSIKNFVDLSTQQTINGQKSFTQLLHTSGGLSINTRLSLAGQFTPLQLNGSSGAVGDVLMSSGPTATPVWVNLQQAIGIKSKNRSALLTAAEDYDIPILRLDENDGVSIVLEVGYVPNSIPSYYILRDIANSKVTVHFTAPYTGYVTWVVVD